MNQYGDYRGYWYDCWSSAGANGVYTNSATAISASNWGLWVASADSTTHTLDGWRQKTIKNCDTKETKSYSWAVDIGVQITGTLDDHNSLLFTFGSAKAYGWAKMILTGLDSKTAETKGDPFDATQPHGSVAVSGPIKVSVPINIDGNGVAPLNGDDAQSSSGTKDCVSGDHIRVRGITTARATVSNSAAQAQITSKTTLSTFTLTPN